MKTSVFKGENQPYEQNEAAAQGVYYAQAETAGTSRRRSRTASYIGNSSVESWMRDLKQ